MRHFRPEGEEINHYDEQKTTYQQKVSKALKSITSLLPFVEFTVNYGFAIENVWVTMLMITHKTPDVIDSFIWILPIVIAIFIRPYIVRYVHQLRYKVLREINMVSLFLVIGAVGCFLVGESCRHDKKSQMVRRIGQCIIGWTLMDLSFQFCQFFAEKIQESSKELAKVQQKAGQKQGQNQIGGQGINKRQNFEFYGLFLGYVVSLLICWITHGKTQFYKCCRYAYWTVAGLSFITGLRLYIESHLNLPHQAIQQSPRLQRDTTKISTKLSYYLPGLQQLLNADFRTISLLLLHSVILFLNDVIMIYTTMWFSQPAEAQYKRHGEALITGLQYGSIALLMYTIIDNLKITKKPISSIVYFQVTMSLVIVASVFCFYLYSYVTFSVMAVLIAVLNQLYRHSIFNSQFQQNPVFERCIQIVERLQKIYVLAVMPPIVMLGLGRNDIQDCLIWAAGMASVGVCSVYLTTKSRQSDNKSKTCLQTIKVSKVE